MCVLMQERDVPNTDLHVKTYVQSFDKDMLLHGEVTDFSLPNDLVISKAYIVIPFIVN